MIKMEKNWFLIISILFLGCGTNNLSGDKDLINRDVFKSILVDCEKYPASYIDTIKVDGLLSDSLILDIVLKNYNCSKESYYKTLSFYMDAPDTMLVILNDVKDSLHR